MRACTSFSTLSSLARTALSDDETVSRCALSFFSSCSRAAARASFFLLCWLEAKKTGWNENAGPCQTEDAAVSWRWLATWFVVGEGVVQENVGSHVGHVLWRTYALEEKRPHRKLMIYVVRGTSKSEGGEGLIFIRCWWRVPCCLGIGSSAPLCWGRRGGSCPL